MTNWIRRHALLWMMLVACALRGGIFLLGFHRDLYFPDEFEYVELANHLADGKGYTFQDQPTSYRPPGWPFLISLSYRLTAHRSPDAVRAMQLIFSIATVWLVYRIGSDGVDRLVGLTAGWILALYPSLIGYNNMLLTEPSFICCIALAGWATVQYLRKPSAWRIGLTGGILGLGALIRDTLFYVVCGMGILLLAYALLRKRPWIKHIVILMFSFAVVVGPWIVRNTLVQKQLTLLSTVGSINLYLCNNEQTPMVHTGYIFMESYRLKGNGYYYDLLFPELKGKNEAEKAKVATRKGIEYMVRHPGTTALRSLGRFMDFWGQERMVINQVVNKYYGEPSPAVIWFAVLAIGLSYSLVCIGSILGYFFSRWKPFDTLGLIFCLLYLAMHIPVQGHPRYHMPLLPVMAVVAAQAVVNRKAIGSKTRDKRFRLAAAVAAGLIIMWTVNIFLFDANKLGVVFR